MMTKMNILKLILLLTLMLSILVYFLSPILSPTPLPPTPVSSKTYFVAKNGNDYNPGTEQQPWRTIMKATDTLVAGDTVYIKNGTYNEKINVKNSGSPGNYITFSVYPGDSVTIDGMGIPVLIWDGLVQIHGSSYINISGFRIINSMFMGVVVTSDYGSNIPTNITIEKNYVRNTASSAIYIEDGKNITIDGNEITKAQTLEGLSQRKHETISLANVNGFEINNNKLYLNNAESIDVKDGSSNGRIHHNDISQHESAGIYIDSWNGSSSDIEIFSNRVHDGRRSGRGIAIAIENGGRLRNVNAYSNLIYDNAATGIDISWYSNGLMENISIISNTVYNNGLVDDWGGGISLDYSSAVNVTIRNNIVSKNNHYSIRVNNVNAVIDHNLIDGYKGRQDETKGSNYVEGDPEFVNRANADFHLMNTSPAINRGSVINVPNMDLDGKIRSQDVGYDIGAFEFIS